MAYGDFVIQRDLDFVIRRSDIFIIMGGSGCGKSTLLRHLVGLKAPAREEYFTVMSVTGNRQRRRRRRSSAASA